jgi:asparagine synthase (glutamine-hydrolysing)
MCGIAGFYQSNILLTKEDLKCMSDRLAHRGPDADGFYLDENIGLAHRRLSILDLSAAANQPMFSQDENYVIVYNGEIFNFHEIADSLNQSFKTSSDTEVILEAFIKWGPTFVHQLNGMFSIVIYNKIDKSVFICRDRLGIKPLYYFLDEDKFIFSSELKSILSLRPKLKLSLDKKAVHEYLLLGYVPEPLSICKEVKKFPSGSYALLRGNKLEITSYWQPEEKINDKFISDEKEAKKQLKELLNSSVKYRMISDVPFGTFLSGGIDSSLVTAIAQANSETPINTFSIGFNESKHNESSYAHAVAKQLGTKHHEFTVTEKDALELLDRMTDAYDEPFADSSGIPTMLVSKLARQHVTMTLSGDGGDELFHGYGSYLWAKRLSNPLVQIFRKPIGTGLKGLKNSKYDRIATLFNYQDKARIKSHIFSQEIYYFSHAEIRELTNDLSIQFSADIFDAVTNRQLTPAEEQALFDIRFYLKDDLLAKVDRATMQFSLEARVPLLDYRIVEFALNIDPLLKIKNGDAKYLLKQVLYDYLPSSLFNRPKWGFSIPLDKWLKGELNFLLEKYTSKEICEKFGLINYSVLNKYKNEFNNGKIFYYNRLWQIIVLHKTLEKLQLN